MMRSTYHDALTPGDTDVRSGSYGLATPFPPPPTTDGELDIRRFRLIDLAGRLSAITDNGQIAVNRRYGESSSKGADNATAPCRSGSVGALDDVLDRLESCIDRAGAVVGTLAAL